jgi:hypothetical protein
MNTNPRLNLLAVAVLLAACGDVTRSTTARIDVTGGTMALESGLQLDVPADALPANTSVTLRETHHGDDVIIEVEPRGLELNQPATVSWNDDGRSPELESGEKVETERHGNRNNSKMSRLGTIVLRGHRSDDADGGHQGRGSDDADAGDDHGSAGHGADDADGGVDDHGSAGQGADDADAGVDDRGANDLDGGVDGGDDHGGSGGGSGGGKR